MIRRFFFPVVPLFLLLIPLQAQPAPAVETLVCIRHGEKPRNEIGQLDAQGLNRSLALPSVLIGRYGRPQYIFAPDPADEITDPQHNAFCYVRPLATIEPTAIYLDLPVNTLFGFRHIHELETEIEKPLYAHATIFIAWEHGYLEKFVRQVVTDNRGDGAQVPKWQGNDYDSIYVVRLTQQPGAATPSATFTLDHEGLDHLSNEFPAPASP